ncbi:MAG TPA: hypothetical protein VKQ07_09995 [Jatrophihabitantaceae bacterium]|nr:hypothetical protein [Jatrophihabitantaceae bacterium]
MICTALVDICTALEDSVLTQSLADAILEAEKVIAGAPHIETEQDLLEGYEYLAGSVRAAVQSAFAHEKDFPFFMRSATPYTKLGLDNPDTLYFSARIRADAEYVVTGTRGTTADLSFQILSGDYNPEDVPDSLQAFDDREVHVEPDGTFVMHFGPSRDTDPSDDVRRNYFTLAPGANMLLVREVWSDWTATPGTIRIQRVDKIGAAPPPLTEQLLERRFDSAGKALVQQLKTFLQFPEWFYLKLPVNTMTEPRLTPGGLATQYSSVGHYDLRDDQALIVTVPASDAPYQGFQLGSMWYVSLDFANHQTSLTAHQAQHDADGMIRFVVSERNPGVANWLETTGHRRGYLQIRWQRTSREFTVADGPTVELVDIAELPARLGYYEQARVTPEQWRERIAARQAAVANRMLG